MPTRFKTTTQKIKTDFGSMYIHIDIDEGGKPLGGSISHPRKEETSQISQLIEELSVGMNMALKEGVGDEKEED